MAENQRKIVKHQTFKLPESPIDSTAQMNFLGIFSQIADGMIVMFFNIIN